MRSAALVACILLTAAGFAACVDLGGLADRAPDDAGPADAPLTDAPVTEAGGPDADASDARLDAHVSDGGMDADASDAVSDADGGFTPAALDKVGLLALWLAASSADVKVDAGGIVRWNDRSSLKNDAVADSVTLPKLDPGARNGNDAVAFQNGNSRFRVPDAPSLQFGGDDFAVFAVAKLASGGPNIAAFYVKTTNACTPPGPVCSYVSGPDLFITGPADGGAARPLAYRIDTSGEATSGSGLFENGTFHLVGVRRRSSAYTIYADSTVVSAAAVPATLPASEPGVDVLFGGVNLTGVVPPMTFEIAEIIAVHSSTAIVSDTVADEVLTYLRAKYAL